jgi:hypothetical protein
MRYTAPKLRQQTLGVEVVSTEIQRAEDIEPAFEALKGRAETLYVFGDPIS